MLRSTTPAAPVAKQGSGHKHCYTRIGDAQAERAEVDGEKQDMRADRHGLRVASGAGEPPNAAPAAKSKDRQTFHRARKSQPVHQLRIETWDGKPRDGIDDERTNIVEFDRRRLGRFESHLLEQVKRMALEDGGTRFPSMALMIPVRTSSSWFVIATGLFSGAPTMSKSLMPQKSHC